MEKGSSDVIDNNSLVGLSGFRVVTRLDKASPFLD